MPWVAPIVAGPPCLSRISEAKTQCRCTTAGTGAGLRRNIRAAETPMLCHVHHVESMTQTWMGFPRPAPSGLVTARCMNSPAMSMDNGVGPRRFFKKCNECLFGMLERCNHTVSLLTLSLLLQARCKSNPLDGGDHLRCINFPHLVLYNRLLLRKTDLCVLHTGQPFQGLLHQEWSTRSGHAAYVEDQLGLSGRDIFGELNHHQRGWGTQQVKLHPVTRNNAGEECRRRHREAHRHRGH